MKRLCSLAIISLLALSGCHRAPSGTATDVADKPGQANDNPGTVDNRSSTFTPQTGRLVSSEDVPLLEQLNRESTKVVAAAMPSIVRITAMGPPDPRAQFFGDLPFKIPFGHGGSPGAAPSAPSVGSGVIISKDGYIVTNYHVLEDAQSVEVQLHDQRTFPARIVASDEPLDIAVLKIQATDLSALPWGDSDKVEVGEQVFAIGNPFDLDESVTRGIVSAKGRDLPDSAYNDYIQTDAAINVGNSGGALVNIHGELIGINAAIASFTRGSEGVGFSIPSNMVRYAVENLLRQGRIVRGYLGVRLPVKIDDGVAEQLGLNPDRGALLAGILRRSPAETAKLQPVDFITEIDGHKINDIAGLRLTVAQIPVGKQVVVNYIRSGTPRSTTVQIAELPKEEEFEGAFPTVLDPGRDVAPMDFAPAKGDDVLSALQVTDLNDKTRQKYGIDHAILSGVVVTGVQAGSSAEAKGLLQGDVIDIACARRGLIQPLANVGDFAGLAKELKPGQGVVLLVHHGQTSGAENRSSMFIYLGNQPK